MSLRLLSGISVAAAFGPVPGTQPECIPPPEAATSVYCEDAFEQSPIDVTEGMEGDRIPKGTLEEDYKNGGLCQVNVHWHLGAEHRSEGEYDVPGADFYLSTFGASTSSAAHEASSSSAATDRHLLSDDPTPGWFCGGYDAEDPKYTTPYDWQHCEHMQIGATYEIHWPYSTDGHCGRLSDGLGGVFCKSHTPRAIGVQGQVFVVVNDDAYAVEDLAHGMNMTMAENVAKYTGSTTGEKYTNEDCSPYAPISWHVDPQCHLVAASSFDAMCATMKEFGMAHDIAPHGSRTLVNPEWVTTTLG